MPTPRVIFVQRINYPLHSVSALATYLESNGIETEVILNTLVPVPTPRKNDIICFSFTTSDYKWAYDRSKDFRHHQTVAGGPHATLYPEHAAKHFDHVIVGEGEEALLELTLGYNPSNIKNRYPNPLRPLLDLTDVPPPNPTVYYRRYPFLAQQKVKSFITGRGCPFNCSFCINPILNSLYRGQPLYRKYPVSSVIDTIKKVMKSYPLKRVSFSDDVFAVDLKWLTDFSETYRTEIGIPFTCNIPVTLVSDEVAHLLRKAGCVTVEFGIETADDFTRRSLLSKPFTTKHILKATEIIKDHGLSLKTYNMVGLPGESFDQAYYTLLLNHKIKPKFSACSFCTLYPKYPITQTVRPTLTLEDTNPNIYSPDRPVDPRIIRLQHLWQVGVKHPRLVKHLTRLPLTPLYRYISNFTYHYGLGRAHGYNPIDMIRLKKYLKVGET